MTLKIRKIAILGATGPTGRALESELRRRGRSVRVVSRRMENLKAAFPGGDSERYTADALDPDSLMAAIDGCDCVVDCIGLPAGQMADHPTTARNIAVAIDGTGTRCLQVSSYWSYIPIDMLPVSEQHPRTGGPPWACLRREAEDILRDAGAAIVHLPDFFGPNVHTSTVHLALRDALDRKPMNWIGSAEVERDYIYVPDAMRVVADLLEREQAYGDDWIVPGSGPVSGHEIAAILSGILGRNITARSAGALLLRAVSLFNRDLRDFMQLVPTYSRSIRYDGSKLEALLGPTPRTTYEDGLIETVRAVVVPA